METISQETTLAIIALCSAVMSLAREVNVLSPRGLSDETIEKCRDATAAIGKIASGGAA